MKNYKLGTATNGEVMHYSVGALIERDGKYLLIDRVNPPFGFAGLAGHVDEGESDTEAAIKREVEEESKLIATKIELLFEEELLWNRDISHSPHYWRLYKVEVDGEIHRDTKEEKSIDWYSVDEIRNMELEPVWKYWFEKLKII